LSTVNQTIVAKIISNLKLINGTGGYSFNIAGKVFDWRETIVDDAELPIIVVRDPAHQAVESGDLTENELDIEIVLIDTPGETSPATLRDKRQDILNAFKLIENETYVAGAQYLESELQVDHAKKKTSGTIMKFSVLYDTARWGI
jgi:hypothetical protein